MRGVAKGGRGFRQESVIHEGGGGKGPFPIRIGANSYPERIRTYSECIQHLRSPRLNTSGIARNTVEYTCIPREQRAWVPRHIRGPNTVRIHFEYS